MTWDIKDLGRRQGEPVPVGAAGPADGDSAADGGGYQPPRRGPALMPRLERVEQLLQHGDASLPTMVRREMLQVGLVDEVTWGHWRQLMTRGVYEEL